MIFQHGNEAHFEMNIAIHCQNETYIFEKSSTKTVIFFMGKDIRNSFLIKYFILSFSRQDYFQVV